MCLEGKIKGWVDGLDWGQQCWRKDREWLPGWVFNSSMFDPSPIHELCPEGNKDLSGPLCPAGASLLQETLRVAELINSARVTCLKKQIWTCWFRFKDSSPLLLFCTRVPQGTRIAGLPRLGGGIWNALMKFIRQIFTEHPLCARHCLRAGEITENTTEKNLPS